MTDYTVSVLDAETLCVTHGPYSGPERRQKPRIYEPFPAKIRGEDAVGEKFELETVLDNIGPGGLFVRLPFEVFTGEKLFLTIRLSSAPGNTVFAPIVALRGTVLRTEAGPNGKCGLAVAITHHRFL
jgi:hypothetical protein